MMAPTIEDLRQTLEGMADEHPAPAPRDLLAELRAERAAGRRTKVALGAAAAAAAVVVGSAGMQLLGQTEAAPAPAGTGSAVERGWALADGEPPAQADGLVRLAAVDAPYDDPGTIQLPDTESLPSAQRWAVLWCDTGPDDAAITPPSLRLTAQGGEAAGAAVEIPCVPEGGVPSGTSVTPVALPPGDGLSVEADWLGDVPARGHASLGVYQEASRSDYDFPAWPDPPLTPPLHGANVQVVDPSSPRVFAPGRHADTRSVTVTLTSDSTLELWRGVPGRLEIAVDDVPVTVDGEEDAASWRTADPELRAGAWDAFVAGQRRTLALPPEVLPAPGETRTVRLDVLPRGGDQQWQVAVTSVVTGPTTVEPSDAQGDLPEWVGGMHLVATWQVPTSGVPVLLGMPQAVPTRSLHWVVLCPSTGTDASDAMATAVMRSGGDDVERICHSGEHRLDNAMLDLMHATPTAQPLPVQVALPARDSASMGLVAAYERVDHEEFDFAAAAPLPELDPLGASPEELEVVETVTTTDLDADGTARVILGPDMRKVRVHTEGVGRIRFTLDGRVMREVRTHDGWWSSWTDKPVTSVPVVWMQFPPATGSVLGITVDGYDAGAVEIELLSAVAP